MTGQTYTLKVNPKGYFAFSEIDGLKLITNKNVVMLRKIPESYENIFRFLSFEPGAMLYEAYIHF